MVQTGTLEVSKGSDKVHSHGLVEKDEVLSSHHTSSSNNLLVLNVVGCEIVLADVSINDELRVKVRGVSLKFEAYIVIGFSVANVGKGFIESSSPEEWNSIVRNHFTGHVHGSEGSHSNSLGKVLNSSSLSSVEVRE